MIWSAGRLTNQLHFLQQCARIVNDRRVQPAADATWCEWILVLRAILRDEIRREEITRWQDSQRQNWLDQQNSEGFVDALGGRNIELHCRWRDGGSFDLFRRAMLDEMLSLVDRHCEENLERLLSHLSPEQQSRFLLARDIDRLVRPIPAYQVLTLEYDDAAGVSSDRSAAAARPPTPEDWFLAQGQERAGGPIGREYTSAEWLLPRLPVRTPSEPSNVLVGRITADMERLGIQCNEAVLRDLPAETLARYLEEQCLASFRRAEHPPRFESLGHLGLWINASRRQVRRDGFDAEIALTEKEHQFFETVGRAGSSWISVDVLLDELGIPSHTALDTRASRINNKLVPLQVHITSPQNDSRALVEGLRPTAQRSRRGGA